MKNFSLSVISVVVFVLLLGANSLTAQVQVKQSWDFESTMGDWVSGGGGASIALSTEQAHGGTQSLKMVKPGTGTEINLQNDVYEPVEGDSLIFWVWISTADMADVNGIQIFWQDGAGWTWHSQWFNGTDQTGNAWNRIAVVMPAVASPMQRIGLQFTGKTGIETHTPAMYVDDISVTHAAALTIVVDGNKDAFYDGLTGPADGYLQLRNYAGNNNGTPVNNADLSAKVWTAWDSTWFYFYAEVMDDTISDNGVNSYQDDGLELKIDPKATDSVANSIFAPNFTALGGTGSDSLNAFPATAKQWVRKTITGGYALEFAVRWDSIGATEKVSAKVDSVFGLAINFHDNDGNLNIGGGRQASVQWAAVMMDQVWNTPKYLGTVKFLAGNKLSFIAKNNMTNVTNPIPFDGTPFYVNIDGARDPIYNIATAPDNGYLQIRSYAYNNNGKPASDADLSAKVWSVWDPTWFYMYAEVTDDTISDNGVNSYQDDGLELKIDPKATDSVANSIFSPNFTALGGTGSDSLNAFPAGAKKWSRTRTATGYTLEFAVRWDSIGTSEKVSVGVDSVFGLAINFHDNDGNLSIGGGRQASVQWAAVMLDQVWNTPKYLGTVKFLADNKLSFIPKNNMTGVYNPIPYNGKDTVVTGVQRVGSTVPANFSLGQNYPNPFNPSTTIQFGLPVTSNVRITLFNMLGQMVGEVARGEYEAGNHRVVFNASHMASGVYLYRLEAGSFSAVKKLVLLK